MPKLKVDTRQRFKTEIKLMEIKTGTNEKEYQRYHFQTEWTTKGQEEKKVLNNNYLCL